MKCNLHGQPSICLDMGVITSADQQYLRLRIDGLQISGSSIGPKVSPMVPCYNKSKLDLFKRRWSLQVCKGLRDGISLQGGDIYSTVCSVVFAAILD